MTYASLAEGLRKTADRAKQHFAKTYGATSFVCEAEVKSFGRDLPLRPTWQASLQDGYRLCLEVQASPISPTIHEFVNKCAARCAPIKLWIAVPGGPTGSEFAKQLKEAREAGVGVIQIPEDNGAPFEIHKPIALSLFALRPTDLKLVENKYRGIIKKAEDAFHDGSPEDGCRQICEEIEAITRRFAHLSYKKKWWTGDGSDKLKERFFTKDSWANMLQQLDRRIIEDKVQKKCSVFNKEIVAGARSYTNVRNSLNHRPKSLEERKKRDVKLRTTFEATRDLLLEWFKIEKTLKLDT